MTDATTEVPGTKKGGTDEDVGVAMIKLTLLKGTRLKSDKIVKNKAAKTPALQLTVEVSCSL